MQRCAICTGPVGEASSVSKELRGFTNKRGKALLWYETGRIAHYACAELAAGGTWVRQQEIAGWEEGKS